jgi:hypothetical protein
MCHAEFWPPVTSLESDMKSSYMLFIHNFNVQWPQLWVTWGHLTWFFLYNFNLQWPQWWVILGHPFWCIIHNIFLQWTHWWVTWGHPISCVIYYFDLKWLHWWVIWVHPNWCDIQNFVLVISITHPVSYNWAHRRSNFRVTSHGTDFLVPPVRSQET